MNKYPVSDSDCKHLGWKQAHVSCGVYELSISHSPDAELDSTFIAYDHDEQELIRINGWLIEDYREIGTTIKEE